MPVVNVDMLAGRTVQQKKQLASEITTAFEKIDVPKDNVHIIFNNHLKQDWAIGGKLTSEEESNS